MKLVSYNPLLDSGRLLGTKAFAQTQGTGGG